MKIIFGLIIFLIIFSSSLMPVLAESKVPDWVRNIFVWYGDEQIPEEELVSALEYLIDQGILQVTIQNNFNQIVDRGDLIVSYHQTNNQYFNELIPWLEQGEEWIINSEIINQNHKFPYDIPVTFDSCGESNAFYEPETKEIIMCYEFVQYFITLFDPITESDEELEIMVQDTLFFVFMHELGHAFVDVYQLPITGNEEDAVDQYSAIVLLSEGQQGIDALDSVTFWFEQEGAIEVSTDNLYFWDVHSLSLQRYYNIMCLVYGGNPDANSFMIDYGYVPEERAVYCSYEHEKANYAWDTILKDVLK